MTQPIVKAQNARYAAKPERVEAAKLKNREKYLANREEVIARNGARKKLPEVKARRNLLWRENRAKDPELHRKAFRERYREDPEFRLRGNIRSRVWEALKSTGGKKESSVLNALGYSLERLKHHLESQFQPGMSWDVPKSFSVDHIIPQSMFSYLSLSDEEFRLCWSLDNLRPLPLGQNYAEGNRSHLFLGVSNWKDLAAWASSIHLGSSPEEIGDVFPALAEIALDGPCPRESVGLGLLDSIFQHRFDAKTSGKPSLKSACSDPSFVLKVAAYVVGSGRPLSERLFYRNAAFLNKTPAHFFPSAAAALVRRYAPGGSVVDPFLGWGGRTLGALCGGASSVCGTDLQGLSVSGCRELVSKVSHLRAVDSEFIHSDFASYLEGTPRTFDLLLTSPPFMATEDYGNGGHSDVRSWVENIVHPLVRGAHRVVRSGGHVAIHCQDRSGTPVLTAVLTAFTAASWQKVGEHEYGKASGQVVLAFRKP